MEQAYTDIIKEIDDLGRPGLTGTPERAARAMRFLTKGYSQDLEQIINDARFPTQSSEMVVVQDIELYSLCEHHLLPFVGKCHVAYIPDKFVIGLSKIARIVDMFARRLQNQENLTMDIARAMNTATEVEDVAVIIESKHLCMMMRGVEKQNSRDENLGHAGYFQVQPQHARRTVLTAESYLILRPCQSNFSGCGPREKLRITLMPNSDAQM